MHSTALDASVVSFNERNAMRLWRRWGFVYRRTNDYLCTYNSLWRTQFTQLKRSYRAAARRDWDQERQHTMWTIQIEWEKCGTWWRKWASKCAVYACIAHCVDSNCKRQMVNTQKLVHSTFFRVAVATTAPAEKKMSKHAIRYENRRRTHRRERMVEPVGSESKADALCVCGKNVGSCCCRTMATGVRLKRAAQFAVS